VRTFGCQMNVHDSERLSGSLESAGYVRAEAGAEADVVVINTCAVRDNAAGKLYGTLGHLKSRKDRHEGMQIAVGGCMAQMDKDAVLDKAPWVDVVFGTHNMGALPSLLERARHNGEAELEILEALEVFPHPADQARLRTAAGCRSRSAATTRARSASCRACAARRRTAAPATS
jgi:tRNA-2-methylthio-N6-dimethylallyladenosine synthase